MIRFEPIAIIGQGCVLPGSFSPDELWKTVYNGKVEINSPPDNYWRTSMKKIIAIRHDVDLIDKTYTDKGGYISGFESFFNHDDYQLDQELIPQLDSLFKWSLYAANQALKDAGYVGKKANEKTGIILGNLSYPTDFFSQLYEQIYMQEFFPDKKNFGKKIHPINRFMSGLPALMLKKGLGLGGDGFCIDAACSASLYAIKLACDKLVNRSENMVLVGGVNASDSLFLHVGFTALRAMSPTGQSRPFNKNADGLIPAEGAAFLLLKRLSDAVRDKDKIAGVIRGIGLSNDGRAGGFLLPSVKGQIRCIKQVFSVSGIAPKDISLVECHATGTKGGDLVEIQSMAEVFSGCNNIVMSSLKANIGHSITTSGMAGLIKLLGCIKYGIRPHTPNAFPLFEEIENSSLKVLQYPEPWEINKKKIACLSSFGFGGNNAHIIIEEYKKYNRKVISSSLPKTAKTRDIAIVALGIRINQIENTSEFLDFLLTGNLPNKPDIEGINFKANELTSPPKDMEHALGQQLILLNVVKEALSCTNNVNPENTGVFIGMGTDAEINRYGFRWRLNDLIQRNGIDADEAWLHKAKESLVKPLTASGVIGTMPNMVANRINNAYDFQGPGFSISCEELSGVKAFEIAVDQILKNEIETAIVGAVDICKEKVHKFAAQKIMGSKYVKGADAAVILVLKDYKKAKNDKDTILAVLDNNKSDDDTTIRLHNNAKSSITALLGHSHAASGLVHIAEGVLLSAHRCPSYSLRKNVNQIIPDNRWVRVKIENKTFAEHSSVTRLRSEKKTGDINFSLRKISNIYTYAANDKNELYKKIKNDILTTEGSYRLAIIATPLEKEALRNKTCQLLENGNLKEGWNSKNVVFHKSLLNGELAFAFTGLAASYQGMGKELVTGFPYLADALDNRVKDYTKIAKWIYRKEDSTDNRMLLRQLCEFSFISQIHAEVSSTILGLKPDAALGLSSGEINSLFALGVWDDMDGFLNDVVQSGLYTEELAEKFNAVKTYWKESDDYKVEWGSFILLAPVEDIKKLLKKEKRVYLTIINTNNNCIISGDKNACKRIIRKIGKEKAILVKHDLAVHCPVAKPFEEKWHKCHTRPSKKISNIRFYSSYFGRSYLTKKENIKEALTGQVLTTIDFPKIVNQAWEDGVRIFIEHGPRNSLSMAIDEILKDKPHLAVPLDIAGTSAFLQVFRVAAELWCSGVKVKLKNLKTKYLEKEETTNAVFNFPMRLPKVSLPKLSYSSERVMESPPELMPVHILMDPNKKKISKQYIDNSETVKDQTKKKYPGLSCNREQLEILASGKISSVFGSLFENQDKYDIQVRMPEPPLLLCDRVLGIEGVPGSLRLGTIWTETDIKEDSWYLHNGHMPAGIFIESGQADLLLISWLGIDSHNKGKRAYRLLGCELIFHGSLPKPGDTLQYAIHVTGHAKQGDVRLFFFNYNCRIDGKLRISVKNGQAGFFTKKELSESGGVIWSSDSCKYTENPRLDIPKVHTKKKTFSKEEVKLYTNGDMVACFGKEFIWTQIHTRTPRSQRGKENFIGSVIVFDINGGPSGRGYLKSESMVSENDWYFKGHFKNDPCMPGTLMAEACLQMMAFYMIGLGFSIYKDGWRFEPVPELKYKFICRGQVIPSTKIVTYEIFIDEIISEPYPTIYAHVLCKADGVKAFLCERLGLRMVPDWPLSSMKELLPNNNSKVLRPTAEYDGFKLDYHSLINCALGQPSLAFGKSFFHYDGILRSPRLPGPPYQFMSRISELHVKIGQIKNSPWVKAEYDIPKDAWYFKEDGRDSMPYCVLMEIGLQPCGWMATFVLRDDIIDKEFVFRNLDGTATQYKEIFCDDNTIVTKVMLSSVSKTDSMIILNFDVDCFIEQTLVFNMKTNFGFFMPEVMRDQKGIPIASDEQKNFDLPNNLNIPLNLYPEKYFQESSARLPSSKLLMLDRITHYYSKGGKKKLGFIRAEKDVKVNDWFFKAHFFQDPVQPGSLGVEGLIQLLQFYMLHNSLHKDMKNPIFESIMIGSQTEWHYRGQVTPDKKRIVMEAEILEQGRNKKGYFVIAEARLWLDGIKVYHVPRIGMRLIEGNPSTSIKKNKEYEWEMNINENKWVMDHSPTYTIPSIPLTFEIDMMARAVADLFPDKKLVSVNKMESVQWMLFDQKLIKGKIVVKKAGDDLVKADLKIYKEALNIYETCATAIFCFDDNMSPKIQEIDPLLNEFDAGDPYEDGRLFHGTSFQLMSNWILGSNGAKCKVQAKSQGCPIGLLHPGLLDASIHCIPHDNFQLWDSEISNNLVAYPISVKNLRIYGEFPTKGRVDVEARFIKVGSGHFPTTNIWIKNATGLLLASFTLVEILLPKGPLGTTNPHERKIFFLKKRYIKGISLTRLDDSKNTLYFNDIKNSDWLPGTIKKLYEIDEELSLPEIAKKISFKEHAANSLLIHPSNIHIKEEKDGHGRCENTPFNEFNLTSQRVNEKVIVNSIGPGSLNLEAFRKQLIKKHGLQPVLIIDLILALMNQFVRRVIIQSPLSFKQLMKTPVLYIGNHHTNQVESFLFMFIVETLTSINIREIIDFRYYRKKWYGQLFELWHEKCDELLLPVDVTPVDKMNSIEMLKVIQKISVVKKQDLFSIFVSSEGVQEKQAEGEITELNSDFIDLSIKQKLPIVPVKFCGGLPREKNASLFEFPVNYSPQDYYIGRPISPLELKGLPLAQQKKRVLMGINNLDPGDNEISIDCDQDFMLRVNEHSKESFFSEGQAIILESLSRLPNLSSETKKIVDKILCYGESDQFDKGSFFYRIFSLFKK